MVVGTTLGVWRLWPLSDIIESPGDRCLLEFCGTQYFVFKSGGVVLPNELNLQGAKREEESFGEKDGQSLE